MRKGGGQRMGGILYPKIGGIQGSNQAAPREGKNWGQGTFITTYTSLQIGLCSVPYSSEYLGHQCSHMKNWYKRLYSAPQNSFRPASLLPSQIPRTFEPLDSVGPVLVPQLGFCLVFSPLLSNSFGFQPWLQPSSQWELRCDLGSFLWLCMFHAHLCSLAPHSPDQHSCLALSIYVN